MTKRAGRVRAGVRERFPPATLESKLTAIAVAETSARFRDGPVVVESLGCGRSENGVERFGWGPSAGGEVETKRRDDDGERKKREN